MFLHSEGAFCHPSVWMVRMRIEKDEEQPLPGAETTSAVHEGDWEVESFRRKLSHIPLIFVIIDYLHYFSFFSLQ